MHTTILLANTRHFCPYTMGMTKFGFYFFSCEFIYNKKQWFDWSNYDKSNKLYDTAGFSGGIDVG